MKHHFSAELQPIGIDEKNGIIRGAVACQAGLEARGHSLQTDRVLLNQLLVSAKSKGDKLPVHLDHKSGAAGCIGTAQNFRLDGDKLRCDLHFFRSHDKFQSTMELLSNLHETAGLSASFVGDASPEGMARCRDFLACDVVIFPAAVANGLFSALDENDDNPETENESDDMNENDDEPSMEEIVHALAEHVDQLTDRLEQLETDNEELQQRLDELEGANDDSDDDDDADDDQDDDIDAPVIREKGARSGPNFGSDIIPLEFARPMAKNNFSVAGYRKSPLGSAMESVEFSQKVEALRLTGLDEKTATVRLLQQLARDTYRPLNLP